MIGALYMDAAVLAGCALFAAGWLAYRAWRPLPDPEPWISSHYQPPARRQDRDT